MEQINKSVVQLIGRSPEHFLAEYYRCRNEHKTDRECYEAIEERIKKELGYTRYSSFESFKLQKNKRAKK